MKSTYPRKLDDALKSICECETTAQRYKEILNDTGLIEDFIRQRLASKREWYNSHKKECELDDTESWQKRVLRIVYKENLGIIVPRDGTLVCDKGSLLIIDWQSWCPVLIYCAHTGQPTVPVAAYSITCSFRIYCLWFYLGLSSREITQEYGQVLATVGRLSSMRRKSIREHLEVRIRPKDMPNKTVLC